MTIAPANPPAWLRVGHDSITIEVAVRPRANRTHVLRMSGGALSIEVAAPPERGKANEELIRFIAEIAGVRRGAIAILRGTNARKKALKITTSEPGQCVLKLTTFVSNGKS